MWQHTIVVSQKSGHHQKALTRGKKGNLRVILWQEVWGKQPAVSRFQEWVWQDVGSVKVSKPSVIVEGTKPSSWPGRPRVENNDCYWEWELGCSIWQEQVSYVEMLLLLLSRFSRVQLCVTPWTVAHQAPLSLGFSRQEHWSGLPSPSPMHESEKWKWSRSVVSAS